MAAQINGELVRKGDQVYDLVYGFGQVGQVTDGSFSVIFPNNRELNYVTGGFYNGSTIQRCYWRNPIFTPPLKDDALWETIGDMVTSMISILRSRMTS